jgi:hypothetical protein
LNSQQCPLRQADDFLLVYTVPLALAATGPASTAELMIVACLLIVIGAALTRSKGR